MDMNIPDTIPGIKEALLKHAMENAERFGAGEESLKALWRDVKKLKKHEQEEEEGGKMADTIVTPSGDNAALMALLARGNVNDGGMFGGNGLIGGLILGSLLRNNGNLFGGSNDGAIGAVATQSGVQSVVNQSAIQQELADIKAAIPLAESQLQTAIGQTQNAIQQSVFNAQTVTQAGFAAQVQNLNQIENNILRETNTINQNISNVDRNLAVQTGVITSAITADGEKTRALLIAQNEASLNRQLSDANAQIIALQNKQQLDMATRGVEVNTTNNINQMQQQQQQQQQWSQLYNVLWGLAQNIRSTNDAINVGSGTLTANPTNTNTNIR